MKNEQKTKYKVCFDQVSGSVALFDLNRIDIPENFKDTQIRVRLREKISAIKTWCPDCKQYHLWVLPTSKVPENVKAHFLMIQKYGCWKAYCLCGNFFWDLLKSQKDYEMYMEVIQKIPYEYIERIAADIYAMSDAMRNASPIDALKLASEALASLYKIYKN